MSPLDKVISLCGSQSELARRMTQLDGRAETAYRTGHIFHYLKSGVTPHAAALMEAAVEGQVTRQELCPDFPWDGIKPTTEVERAVANG